METGSEWSPLSLHPEKSGIDHILESFGDLGEHWSVMNEGIPISKDVIDRARKTYFQLRNLGCKAFEAQPGLSGEVLILCEKGDQSIEVILNPDNSYELYAEIKKQEVAELVDLSSRDLMLELRKLLEWKLSESLTLSITPELSLGTLAWHLSHHRTKVASPFSSENAQYRIVDQSASTYSDTMAA